MAELNDFLALGLKINNALVLKLKQLEQWALKGEETTLTTSYADVFTSVADDDRLEITAWYDASDGTTETVTMRFGDIRTDGLTLITDAVMFQKSGTNLQMKKASTVTDTVKARVFKV